MTQIRFPYGLDVTGRTAEADLERHVRDLIEQVLFTAPGERINRPDFGSGLQQLVFAPAEPELVSATEYLVQGALQQWLGERVKVEGVSVEVEDARVTVIVRYAIQPGQLQRTETFSREV